MEGTANLANEIMQEDMALLSEYDSGPMMNIINYKPETSELYFASSHGTNNVRALFQDMQAAIQENDEHDLQFQYQNRDPSPFGMTPGSAEQDFIY
jgi:hypothetical protein